MDFGAYGVQMTQLAQQHVVEEFQWDFEVVLIQHQIEMVFNAKEKIKEMICIAT